MTFAVKRLDNITISNFARMMPSFMELPNTKSLWNDQKTERLIDSILNNIPIGPIFLMRHPRQIVGPSGWAYEYQILDGYSRINAILEFGSGYFRLSDDFRFFESEFVQVGGMTLKDIKETYPMLAKRFAEYLLDIQVVEASSKLEIARMFERMGIDSYCFGRE